LVIFDKISDLTSLYAAFMLDSLAEIMTTLFYITSDLSLTQALIQPATASGKLICWVAWAGASASHAQP